MNYQTFAHVYDEVMDHELYHSWVEFTLQSFLNYTHRKIHHVMELACGTGEVSALLTDSGLRVTGVDLSEEMLKIAKEKYSMTHPTIKWLQKDMRDLTGCSSFDAITLYSDSLCYLVAFEDVLSVFETVYHHLEEEGLFLFDVHSLYQMQQIFPGYQYTYTSEELAFIWQSFEYDEPGSVEHVIDMFVRSRDNLFEHHQEIHLEQTFPMEMYTQALKEVGFRQVWVKADFGKCDVTSDTKRWFFIAKK